MSIQVQQEHLRSALDIHREVMESAKTSDRSWFDDFDDSRLQADACDLETFSDLHSRAPNTYLQALVFGMFLGQRRGL